MKQRADEPPRADAPSDPDAGRDGELARARTEFSAQLDDAPLSARGSAVATGSLPPPSSRELDTDRLLGQVLADRYRIVRLLGVGGMGAVYQAEHVHMRKPVALKVLHKQLTHLDEVVARFEREAIAAANIGNPHVATATDFGRLDDGSFYLVLEYLSGKSLASLLKEGPLPTERALGIALQICRALEAAHAAGIVHRDLKPDNVMLIDKQGQQDYVKVLDFGIAKVPVDADRSGANLTRVGVVFGTPGYMSPEQSVGQVVDHRTDLYALGVILYEMLASRLPFDTDNLPELLAKQVASTPPPLPDHVDSAVSALVMRLLDKTADARPRDAEEVRRLLEELRAGEPAAAPDPTAPFERSWKRRPLVLALAVLVVLGTGFVFFLAEPTREGSEIASPVAAQRAEGLDVEPGATTTDQVAIELATRAMQSGLPASAAKARPQPSKAASGTAPKTNDSVQRASTSKEGSARADSAARSSRGKQKDRGKRRTGPGGIYIPPPSEWF